MMTSLGQNIAFYEGKQCFTIKDSCVD